MGTKLAEYFDKAQEIAGLSGQVKLAMITKFSASKALSAEDSSENIQIFEKAIAQITVD